MNLLKYLILVLLLCNIPNMVRVNLGESLASLISYFSFALLLAYYFFSKKNQLAWPFVIFALVFYMISGLIDVNNEKEFYIDFIKYLILIICGGELARNTSIKELYLLLILGASSIVLHAALFGDIYGRYSGFFFNPNAAGFVCLMGCALSFAFKEEKWKLLGLFFFTFCGLLTFSRTFFLLWTIINIISVFQDKKNAKALIFGLGALILLFGAASVLQLNAQRFSIVESLFNDSFKYNLATEHSRTETWAMFYDKIFRTPFFGNGYESFKGTITSPVGVHNSYLRIIGEAGIIPLALFVATYCYLFIKSLKTFKTHVFKLLLVFSLMALLMATHNFSTNNHVVFISLWLFFSLTNKDLSSENRSKSLII